MSASSLDSLDKVFVLLLVATVVLLFTVGAVLNKRRNDWELDGREPTGDQIEISTLQKMGRASIGDPNLV